METTWAPTRNNDRTLSVTEIRLSQAEQELRNCYVLLQWLADEHCEQQVAERLPDIADQLNAIEVALR